MRLRTGTGGGGLATSAVPGSTLALILVSALCLDFVWLGPATVASYCAIGGLLYLFQWSATRAQLRAMLSRLKHAIIAPWLGLILMFAISDLYHGDLGQTFSAVIIYSCISVVAFSSASTLSSILPLRVTILILSSISILQGGIATLQYLGVDAAWEASTLFSGWAKLDATTIDLSWADRAEALGRARGLHLHTHRFSGLIAPLAASLIPLAFASRRQLDISSRDFLILRFGALAGALGVFASFSRAALISLAIAIAITPLRDYTRTAGRRLSMMAATGVFIALISYLGFTENVSFGRITSISIEDNSINSRLAVWTLALEAFRASPLLGSGTLIDTESTGVGVHSVPLRIFASYGIVAGVLYLLAYARLARTFLGTRQENRRSPNVLRTAALSALVAMFIDSATHTSGFMFYDITQSVLVGSLCGIVAYSGNPSPVGAYTSRHQNSPAVGNK